MYLRTLETRINLRAVRRGSYSGSLRDLQQITAAGFVELVVLSDVSLVRIEWRLKFFSEVLLCYNSVSYTHLDVYKRQTL